MPALPLLHPNQTHDATLGWDLRGRFNATIINGFVHEADDEEPGESREARVDPEDVGPGFLVDDEGCDEGADVGGDDCGAGPDVDFAGMFVEVEDILNVHEAALSPHQSQRKIGTARYCVKEGRYGRALTACATMEKNPFKILAAMYDSNVVAAAHQADVPNAIEVKRTRTGNRPK